MKLQDGGLSLPSRRRLNSQLKMKRSSWLSETAAAYFQGIDLPSGAKLCFSIRLMINRPGAKTLLHLNSGPKHAIRMHKARPVMSLTPFWMPWSRVAIHLSRRDPTGTRLSMFVSSHPTVSTRKPSSPSGHPSETRNRHHLPPSV